MSASDQNTAGDGCCQAASDLTPRYNRPGLPALDYRLATQAAFLRRMLARLHSQTIPDGDHAGSRPLAALTARTTEDPAIALLDAWATAADVLAFYQERIANEGYLRTATERGSVLELARAIGYELSPGVAAATWLAFTVDEAAGAPGVATVPKGTQVQSLPPPNQLPQTFETVEQIEAQAVWNKLTPRLTQPQKLVISSGALYLEGLDGTRVPARQLLFEGTSTNLKTGDRLVVITARGSAPVTVKRVVIDSEQSRTRIILDEATQALPTLPPSKKAYASLPTGTVPFTAANIRRYVLAQKWRESDLQAFLTAQNWSAEELLDHVNREEEEELPTDRGVFALRSRLGFFGHNAPAYKSLPQTGGQITAVSVWMKRLTDPNDWDAANRGTGRDIWEDSQGQDYYANTGFHVYLERSVALVPGSWAVFEMAGVTSQTYRIDAVTEASLADYGLSARATGLKLALGSTSVKFKTRRTTAWVQSEPLALADLPVEEPLKTGDVSLVLDRMVLGLSAGRRLILSGEPSDAPGVVKSEVVVLEEISHEGGFTTLHFRTPLANNYRRDTVTLNGNVALATHGETVREVLGSGDGAQANQRFVLKKPPLTFISSGTSSGSESTLEVRVNDVLWEEVSTLYGLDARSQSYTVRLDDEGKPTLQFGDGVHGARLPTGQENVKAAYRSGVGLAGEVEAGSLTLLASRPAGIRSVTNPLAASGAEDPETLDTARSNAPLTVRTFDRIVSLQDFEDFARRFPGIGKAQAVALWDGEKRLVHLTVAAASGKTVDAGSTLHDNLSKAIAAARDPVQPVLVSSYRPAPFRVKAGLFLDPRYDATKVVAAAKTALLAAFAFAKREIGQPVTAAEIEIVLGTVPGVTGVDLDKLYKVADGEGLSRFLEAKPAEFGADGSRGAELLVIDSAGSTVAEKKS